MTHVQVLGLDVQTVDLQLRHVGLFDRSVRDISSECWMFYAILTARVIFTAKTSLDVFSLSREEVPICSSRTQCPLYSAASLG